MVLDTLTRGIFPIRFNGRDRLDMIVEVQEWYCGEKLIRLIPMRHFFGVKF